MVVIAGLILLTGYIGLHIYIYRRLLSGGGLTGSSAFLLKILIVVLPLLFPLARVLARFSINRFTYFVDWIGSLWMGVSFYMFLCLLIGHLLIFLARIPLNYHLFITVIALAFAVLISAYAVYEAYRPAGVTRLEVTPKKLPPELDGFKIVHISDLHGGVLADAGYTRRIVEQVNSLSPNLILFTGDLLDERPELVDDIFQELRRLRAPHGVLASTGNHEYYVGLKEVVKKAEEAGIKFLRNEKVMIANNLLVYGIDDPDKKRMGGRIFSFDEVIGKEALSQPTVLLYHRPRSIEKAAPLGVDLMLCGHTHNGQMFPWKYIVKLFFPRIKGAFRYGDCLMYVTGGIGFWGPPMRFLAPREIVLIVFRRQI